MKSTLEASRFIVAPILLGGLSVSEGRLVHMVVAFDHQLLKARRVAFKLLHSQYFLIHDILERDM